MATPTPPTPPVPSDPTADQTETPTTHSKKAQLTAGVLILIVVVGLIFQTYANMQKKGARDEKAQAEQLAREEAKAATPGGALIDFTEKQKEAESVRAAQTQVEKEKSDRAKILQETFEGTTSTAEDGGSRQGKKTIASIEADFALTERMRALQAGTAGLGVQKNASQPAQQAEQSEIAKVDAQIAALQKSDIPKRRAELMQKIEAAAMNGPEGMSMMAAGGLPSRAGAASASPAGMLADLRSQRMVTPGANMGTQNFGELASNRMARDPSQTGPRPGEKMIATGTIISAVSDMDMMSDYVGNWTALVQRPVYDVELENVLLPAGTKIVGKSIQATGPNQAIQSRMGSVPLWAIRPDGKRIDFKRSAVTDNVGVAALEGTVDRHFLSQFMGVAGYAVIGLGPSTSNFGSEPNSSRDSFVREATGKGREIGRAYADKYLNIVPTVKVPSGTPVKIFIEDDIYVTPWESADAAHYKNN